MVAALVSNHQDEHTVKVDLGRAGDDWTRLGLAVGWTIRRYSGHGRIPLADNREVDGPSVGLRSIQRGTLTRSSEDRGVPKELLSALDAEDRCVPDPSQVPGDGT